jgi:hypothetical protein
MPVALKPDRSVAKVSTPAAISIDRTDPPRRETLPMIAAVAAGTSTSDSPTGAADVRLKLNKAPESAAKAPEAAKTPITTFSPKINVLANLDFVSNPA